MADLDGRDRMTSVMLSGAEVRDCGLKLLERAQGCPAIEIRIRGMGPVLIVLSEGDASALLSDLYLAMERQAKETK